MTTMTPLTERAARPPTESIMRMAPFAVRSVDTTGEEGDGLTLDGWAAVFNREVIIDSWEGRFRESLSPGSMRKTFRETTPKLQFDHGTHPMIGSIPIGSVRTAEEATDPTFAPEGGAHVVARLFDNWLTQPLRDAIAEHAINGMSFRFSVVREEWRDKDGKILRDPEVIAQKLMESWMLDVPDDELLSRALKEMKVRELGPVVWPAYEGTSVAVRGKVVIDLAAVRTDPKERRKLADALFIADTADIDPSTATVDGATIGSGRDTSEPTETAGVHVPGPTGTPGATAEAAGNHESSPVRGKRPIDYAVAKAHDTLLAISVGGFHDDK